MRRTLVGFCGVLSVAGLLFGTTYTYVARTLFNPDVFSTRVADGLAQPALARVVASELADQIVAVRKDLIAYRPLIVGSLERVVASAPFRAVVKRAVKRSHETVISETGKQIQLSLADGGLIVRSALSMYPQVAEKVPAQMLAVIGGGEDRFNGELLARVMRVGNRLRTRAIVLLSLGLVMGGLGFALSRRKDAYLLRCGIAMAVSASVLGALARFGGPGVASLMKTDFGAELVRALWPAFIGPLALRMIVLAGIGLVVVAGVTSTFKRVNLVTIARLMWGGVSGRPRHAGLALLRGVMIMMVGGLAAFYPGVALAILAVAAAGLIFFFGLQEIFSIVIALLPRVEEAVSEKRGSRLPLAVATALGVVVIAAGVYWLARDDQPAVAGPVLATCNGHPELCDRRLNEVAFATSHNSMSGGDIADWMFPNQDRGIPGQLEDGVRGFLIDIHYGVPVGDRVRTELLDEVNTMAKYEEILGKEAVEAAMRIRDRMVGKETGERDVYLGHGFCELGATRFVEALEKIGEFLVMNPGEVIIIVIQDEGVTPQDVADCFARSGLDRLVYRGPVTPPWPTLREMIDSDQRVVVLAENNAEGVPWYHKAVEVCQETPYGFKTPEEFSNRPNRGGTAGSLLLMNHWIETTPTPLPSNAAIVNAYDFLLKRARRCQKERGMIPNLVAVDFYRTGDLVRVVDALNGVEQPQTASAR
jgi:hypothetical protein